MLRGERLLAVGLSARAMAEGLVAAGFRADAADCFGDADTLAGGQGLQDVAHAAIVAASRRA